MGVVLPCAFVALMLARGVLGIANIPLPYVEEVILLSVLILGVLIAGAFRFSMAAKFAVEYFARQVRGFISAYAAKSGGIDGLVFTGGIGEHSAQVRTLICEQLEFLGFYLNKKANQSHLTVLNTPSSKPITIIPADEEAEIARLVTDISRN